MGPSGKGETANWGPNELLTYSSSSALACSWLLISFYRGTSIPCANSAHWDHWVDLPHPLFASESIVCRWLVTWRHALTIWWMCCAAAASRSFRVNGAVSLRLTSSNDLNALAQFSWKFLIQKRYTEIMSAQLYCIQVWTSKYMLCHFITWFARCFFLPGLSVFFKTATKNNPKMQIIQKKQKISQMCLSPRAVSGGKGDWKVNKWWKHTKCTQNTFVSQV